ncbi:MAG: hypothetical protein KDD50_13585 [Bdellovibrionales bacterium]|nr:hypothetical protein [Bdellovibrionales bacterium]
MKSFLFILSFVTSSVWLQVRAENRIQGNPISGDSFSRQPVVFSAPGANFLESKQFLQSTAKSETSCRDCYYSACKLLPKKKEQVIRCTTKYEPTYDEFSEFNDQLQEEHFQQSRILFEEELKKEADSQLTVLKDKAHADLKCIENNFAGEECEKFQNDLLVSYKILFPTAKIARNVSRKLRPLYAYLFDVNSGKKKYSKDLLKEIVATVLKDKNKERPFMVHGRKKIMNYDQAENNVSDKVLRTILNDLQLLPHQIATGSGDALVLKRTEEGVERVMTSYAQSARFITDNIPALKDVERPDEVVNADFSIDGQELLKAYGLQAKKVDQDFINVQSKLNSGSDILYSDYFVSNVIGKYLAQGDYHVAQYYCGVAEGMKDRFDNKDHLKTASFFATTMTTAFLCNATFGVGCVLFGSALIESSYVYYRKSEKDKRNYFGGVLDLQRAEDENMNYKAALLLSPLALLGNGTVIKKAFSKSVSKATSSTLEGSVSGRAFGVKDMIYKLCTNKKAKQNFTSIFGSASICSI